DDVKHGAVFFYVDAPGCPELGTKVLASLETYPSEAIVQQRFPPGVSLSFHNFHLNSAPSQSDRSDWEEFPFAQPPINHQPLRNSNSGSNQRAVEKERFS